MIRSVQRVEAAIEVRDGTGFVVRRALPLQLLPHADPFLILEEIGPVNLALADAREAPEHPVRAMELATWMLTGSVRSSWPGRSQAIAAGGAEWATAGAGALYREVFDPGDTWSLRIGVSLPVAERGAPLQVQSVAAADLPVDRTPLGVQAQLLAGRALDAAPRLQTRTRTTVARLQLPADRSVVQTVAPIEPRRGTPTVLVYVLEGTGVTGPAAGEREIRAHQLVLLGPPPAPAVASDANRDEVRVRTRPGETLDVLLLAGLPVGEPVVRRSSFALRSEEEVLQAMEDYRTGRFGTLPP